jgi:hypothetical protein
VFYTQKKISLTEDSPEVYIQKNISLTERATRSLHTEVSQSSTSLQQKDKQERKKALPQPYTRNKNFDTTGAHKTQPANEGFKVPCKTSKLFFFFGSVNNSHVPKTKS